MDSLTASVSGFRAAPPTLPSSSRELFHIKNHTAHLPHRSSSPRPNSISNPPNFLSAPKTLNPLPFSPSPRRSSSPPLHRRPAAGYAAALLHASQSTGSIHAVARDVGRLSRRIGAFPGDEEEKGRLVREIVGEGGFEKKVVKLAKMLMEKKRLGILKEVLTEFERIYDELCGIQVVFVCSGKKMEEGDLFGIAKNVQRLSGAPHVKVRSFVNGGGLMVYNCG